MKTKIIFSIIIIVLAFSLMPMIKAEDNTSQQIQDIKNNLDIWSQIRYNFDHGYLFFSAVGDRRHCGIDQNGQLPWAGDPHCEGSFLVTQGQQISPSMLCSSCYNRNDCGINRDKQCQGGLIDWYLGDSNYLEETLTSQLPYTASFTGKLSYEVYCCECSGTCPSETCTNGQRRNYVCRGDQIWSNLCVNGVWTDRYYKTCTSPERCSTPEVYQGVCSGGNGGNCNNNGVCDSGETVSSCPADCGETKQVGERCSTDLECETKHCDKSGWWIFGSYTCHPIPWDEVKRMSMTREQLGSATTSELISVACVRDNQCLSPGSGYKVDCIPLSRLKDDGVIIDTNSLFTKGVDIINSGATGGAIGGIVGALICAGGVATTVITAPTVAGAAIFGTAAATACSALVTGGVILGASQGLKGGIAATDKDPIVVALKAKDASSVGMCVAESSGPVGDLCLLKVNWLDKSGKMSECTQGWIVLAGGLLILIFLMSAIGGRR